MGKIRSFRDLRVWQIGMEVVVEVYRLSRSFPRSEVYGLAAQVQRAAVSVPSNIAEGHARDHTGEYLQHLSIAQASLAEVETQLEIAVRLQYLSPEQFHAVQELISALGKQLHVLRNTLKHKFPNP